MKKIVFLILIIFSLTVLTGCNTIRGLGKDIKKTGKAIENAAD